MKTLRERLNTATGGALSALNSNASKVGFQGHIIAVLRHEDWVTFCFVGVKSSRTVYWNPVTIRDPNHALANEVQASEAIRLLRRKPNTAGKQPTVLS